MFLPVLLEMFRGQMPRVGLFHDDNALVLAEFPRKLAPAHVHGKHLGRAALEQAIGETAGGRAEVKRDQAVHVQLKMIRARVPACDRRG